MKTKMKVIGFTLALLLITCVSAFAQKGGRHHGGGRPHGRGAKVVVVKRSPYRPNKVIVYRPVWGPKYYIHRRWVYFPKYNLYWDNWRNSYLFWNGAMWAVYTTPPPVIVNVNLENEKHYEMKEDEDDVDDVYKNNDNHKQEYKPE